MNFNIEVQNEHEFEIDENRLQSAAQAVLVQQEVDLGSAMTIVITTDAAVQALNQQHRQVDAPTDVLSFASDPLPAELADDEAPYLGDVVIAYPYTSAQAARENHSLNETLSLLVVHGTLHLLGYDHDTPENRAEMWEAQLVALKTLGVDSAIIPALENDDD